MEAIVWLVLPLFTAAGSALLAFYIMESRTEVLLARQREALVEAKTQLAGHQRELESQLKAVEEETRRRAFDELLADIRVEERHYMRESKSLFMNRKSMVLQERLYFRNIPLSNWVEHELTVEQGSDLASLARAASVFATNRLPESRLAPARLTPPAASFPPFPALQQADGGN
jgi:hypothetical protein